MSEETIPSNYPKKLGKWTIKDRLASRKDKIVLLGEFEQDKAAIKILKNADLLDDRERKPFDQEVTSLLELNHPSIPKIVDLDLSNAIEPWIAIEYISGKTLQEHVEEKGKLKLEDWFKSISDISDALNYIHSRGIIHRDISPSNIILGTDNSKLVDFGLSYVTKSENYSEAAMDAVGTPISASPESLTFIKDTKMDMFSLGSTYVYAGCGASPFDVEDKVVGKWVEKVLRAKPNLTGLSESQVSLLTPLLYKNLQDRVSSAEFLEVLQETKLIKGKIRTNSKKLDSLLEQSEKKLVLGEIEFDLNDKPKKRIFKRIMVLLSLLMAPLITYSYLETEFDYLFPVLMIIFGLAPFIGAYIGFRAYSKGLGISLWGRKKKFKSLLVALGIALSPYLGTFVFLASAMQQISVQNLISDFSSPSALQASIKNESSNNVIQSNNETSTENVQQDLAGNSKSTSASCEESYLNDYRDIEEQCIDPANAGDVRSIYYMGMYEKSRNNLQAAENWLLKSAKKDDVISMEALVQIYIDTNQSQKYAIWVKRCADFPMKIRQVARCKLLYGFDQQKNGKLENTGILYLKDAYEYGNAKAATTLGIHYNNQQDYDNAIFWYERAAQLDEKNAANYLISLGKKLGKFDLVTKWLKIYADKGDPAFASMYAAELALQENYSTAKKYALIGANSGEELGMGLLGVILWKVDNDLVKAKFWLNKAAKANDVNAINTLGDIARLEDKDLSTALEWYMKSEKLGDLKGSYYAGIIHAYEFDDAQSSCESLRNLLKKADSLRLRKEYETSMDEWVSKANESLPLVCT
jgi:serine/threonine protein kinase/TPR repeat protein